MLGKVIMNKSQYTWDTRGFLLFIWVFFIVLSVLQIKMQKYFYVVAVGEIT